MLGRLGARGPAAPRGTAGRSSPEPTCSTGAVVAAHDRQVLERLRLDRMRTTVEIRGFERVPVGDRLEHRHRALSLPVFVRATDRGLVDVRRGATVRAPVEPDLDRSSVPRRAPRGRATVPRAELSVARADARSYASVTVRQRARVLVRRADGSAVTVALPFERWSSRRVTPTGEADRRGPGHDCLSARLADAWPPPKSLRPRASCCERRRARPTTSDRALARRRATVEAGGVELTALADTRPARSSTRPGYRRHRVLGRPDPARRAARPTARSYARAPRAEPSSSRRPEPGAIPARQGERRRPPVRAIGPVERAIVAGPPLHGLGLLCYTRRVTSARAWGRGVTVPVIRVPAR